MDNKYEKLFSPGKINTLTLKNRIIFPPMATYFGYKSGEASAQLVAYFARLARGGAGMLISTPMRPLSLKHRPKLEALAVHQKMVILPPGRIDMRRQISRMAWEFLEPIPAFNPRLYDLIEAVHVNGSRICAHLSPIPMGWVLENYDINDLEYQGIELFNKISVADLEETIREFATTAGELKNIGFDAIEIAGDYMAECFSQESFNKRQDKYGRGSWETRLRYWQELIQATRNEVGKDFPLTALVDVDYFAEGWRTLEESKVMVKKFEEWGIDCIRARGGGSTKVQYDIAPQYLPKGVCVHLAAGIKEVLNIPVIACTKLADPDLAERVLEEGKADFIAIGRGLLADPDLPNKVKAGRAEQVRKCLSCDIGCLGNLTFLPRRPVRCTVNPFLGHEAELPDHIGPAAERKRVVIVGAGPAGMSAALTACHRGHEVVLFEKTGELGGGGHFKLATIAPFKQENLYIPEFYEKEFAELDNLQVRFNTEADADMVMEEEPDAVIVATGGSPLIPELPGVDSPAVINYEDVLLDRKAVGDHAVILGGNSLGCETATYLLLKKGKRVTILGSLHRLADDVEIATRNCLMEELTKAGADMVTMGRIRAISGNEVSYVKDGEEVKFWGDTIVLAMGSKPENGLYEDLRNRIVNLHLIGDAKEPRQIIDAVSEGFWTAYYL